MTDELMEIYRDVHLAMAIHGESYVAYIVHADTGNISRLSRLTEDGHVILVARLFNDSVIAWQGSTGDFVRNELYHTQSQLVNVRCQTVLRAGVQKFCVPCGRCHSTDCLPSFLTSADRDAQEELFDACREQEMDLCSVVRRVPTAAYAHGEMSLTDEVMRGAGFTVDRSRTMFSAVRDAGRQPFKSSVRKVAEAGGLGIDRDKLDDLSIPSWLSIVRGRGVKMFPVGLTLDPALYAVNKAAARRGALRSARTRSDRKAFRSRECARCVYACESLPYSLTARCAVDAQSVIDGSCYQWHGGHEQWQTMLAYTITGRTARLVRSVSMLTCVSRLGGEMIARRLSPPWPIRTLSFEEVIEAFGCPDTDVLNAALSEGRSEKIIYWALMTLSRVIGHGAECRWHGDGRPKRNDVLAVSLMRDGDIVVRTDTCARSGYHRPRFSFTLSYPYFQDFASQLRTWPGSGRTY